MDNNNNLISSEEFGYDHAGNLSTDEYVYDTNNRLIGYNGTSLVYDLDGNLLTASEMSLGYDFANRLIRANEYEYTYDVENIRVRKTYGETVTTYTHNANSKLSQLLTKTENNVTTKYVYGLGLIYETTDADCKIYHYDYRGSTVALTNLSGDVTDTFTYDTYGKLTTRTGTSSTPFLYNGRDGVMSDENGLVYMRARYYSPTFKRFINADVVAGSITNAITLNRYAYANGNPVMFIDPSGYLGILALMGIGALIGAVVGAIGSITSQYISSEIEDEEFKLDGMQVLADTLWGAVDGAISFSPLGSTAMTIAQGVTSVGSSITEELIDDEAGVNLTRVGSSFFFDMTLGKIDLDFTDKVNVSKALKATNETINDLLRRQNEDWAKKQVKRVSNSFNDLLRFKVFEESVNGFLDIGKDALQQKVCDILDLPDYVVTKEQLVFTRK